MAYRLHCQLKVEQLAVQQRQDELAELYAAGDITGRQMATATKNLTERAKQLEHQLTLAGKRTPLDVFAGARGEADISRIWFGPGGPNGDREGGLSHGARRAILDRLVTVTVKPQRRGRPTREPDGSYLDRSSIGIAWK